MTVRTTALSVIMAHQHMKLSNSWDKYYNTVRHCTRSQRRQSGTTHEKLLNPTQGNTQRHVGNSGSWLWSVKRTSSTYYGFCPGESASQSKHQQRIFQCCSLPISEWTLWVTVIISHEAILVVLCCTAQRLGELHNCQLPSILKYLYFLTIN